MQRKGSISQKAVVAREMNWVNDQDSASVIAKRGTGKAESNHIDIPPIQSCLVGTRVIKISGGLKIIAFVGIGKMDNINKYAQFVSFDEKFALIISVSAREDTQEHFLLEDAIH